MSINTQKISNRGDFLNQSSIDWIESTGFDTENVFATPVHQYHVFKKTKDYDLPL